MRWRPTVLTVASRDNSRLLTQEGIKLGNQCKECICSKTSPVWLQTIASICGWGNAKDGGKVIEFWSVLTSNCYNAHTSACVSFLYRIIHSVGVRFPTERTHRMFNTVSISLEQHSTRIHKHTASFVGVVWSPHPGVNAIQYAYTGLRGWGGSPLASAASKDNLYQVLQRKEVNTVSKGCLALPSNRSVKEASTVKWFLQKLW